MKPHISPSINEMMYEAYKAIDAILANENNEVCRGSAVVLERQVLQKYGWSIVARIHTTMAILVLCGKRP